LKQDWIDGLIAEEAIGSLCVSSNQADENSLLAQVHFESEEEENVLDGTSPFTKIEAAQPSLHVT